VGIREALVDASKGWVESASARRGLPMGIEARNRGSEGTGMVTRIGLWCVVLGVLLSSPLAWGAGRGSPTPEGKISLRIHYFGRAGSDRETAFVDFLRKHFTEVRQADLASFRGARVPDADVVILDYDGDYFQTSKIKPPRVSFRRGYDQPTVTLGVFGAMASMNLKTGYL
jgi:hypothetical protein